MTDWPTLLAKLKETWPARLAEGAYEGFTLPHDVMTGKVPIYDASGNMSPEVIGRATDLAGLGTTGGLSTGLSHEVVPAMAEVKDFAKGLVKDKPSDVPFIASMANGAMDALATPAHAAGLDPSSMFNDLLPKNNATPGAAPDPNAMFGDLVPPKRDVKGEFDKLPFYLKIPRAADDLVRLGASGASFGFADKAAAKLDQLLHGGDYASNLVKERQATADARTRAGIPGDVAEIGGSVAPFVLGGPTDLALAGARGIRGAGGALLRGGARVGGGAAEGAGMGALSAVGNDTDIKSGAEKGAAIGAAGGAVMPVVGALAQKVLGKTPIPRTSAQLKAAKTAAYRDAENQGASYPASDMRNTMGDISTSLTANNFDKVLTPKADRKFQILAARSAQPQDKSLIELDNLHRMVNRGNTDDAEGAMSNIMSDHLNRLMDNPSTGGTGATVLKNARELNRQYQNMRAVDEATIRAEDAKAPPAVANKSAFRPLDSPKNRKFLNDPEIEALRQIIRGRPLGNAAEFINQKIPSFYGPLSVGGTVAYGSGSPTLGMAAAAAVPALKYGTGKIANVSSQRAVNNFRRIIDKTPPAPPSRIANAVKDPQAVRMMIALGLLPNQ